MNRSRFNFKKCVQEKLCNIQIQNGTHLIVCKFNIDVLSDKVAKRIAHVCRPSKQSRSLMFFHLLHQKDLALMKLLGIIESVHSKVLNVKQY